MKRRRLAGLSAAVAVACAALAGCAAAPEPSPSPTPAIAGADCIVGVWMADSGQVQRLLDGITANFNLPPVAVGAGASYSFTFASEGALNAFDFAPGVPVTAAWDGTQRTALLGGQLWGTYSASADTIAMATLKDSLVSANGDDSPAGAHFAAAAKAKLAGAPTQATSYRCIGNKLTLGVNANGTDMTFTLTREKSGE